MKNNKNAYGVLFAVLGLVSTGHAALNSNPQLTLKRPSTPGFIITPTPGSETAFTIYAGEQKNTTYTIEKSKSNTRPWNFGLSLPKGIVQTGGTCPQPLFNLDAGTSCTAELQITANDLVGSVDGGYPKVCLNGTTGTHCTKPSLANQLRVIKSTSPPPSALTTLNVDATGIIPVASGPGTITVTNTGTNTAYNVHVTLPSGWTGVTQNASNCASIAPNNGTCSITFTSTTPYVAQGSIVITGDNISNAPTTALAFRYQGGLVFSITGTSPSSTVKVVTENDVSTSSGMQWYNGQYTLTGAQSTTDGAYFFPGTINDDTNGNTYIIVNASTFGVGSAANYAAGLCYNYIDASAANGEWYLPAICELGTYDSSIGGDDAGCGSGTPNIASNLFSLGFLSNLTTGGNTSFPGYYWSSTEYSVGPLYGAWGQYFASSGASPEYIDDKGAQNGVRCVRGLTY